jgi:hypothetical protein
MAVLAAGILIGLVPSACSAIWQSLELLELRTLYESMTKTITVTWPNGSKTTYTGCTGYSKADNGTVSFAGHKGNDSAPLGEYVIGHGQYAEVEVLTDS